MIGEHQPSNRAGGTYALGRGSSGYIRQGLTRIFDPKFGGVFQIFGFIYPFYFL